MSDHVVTHGFKADKNGEFVLIIDEDQMPEGRLEDTILLLSQEKTDFRVYWKTGETTHAWMGRIKNTDRLDWIYSMLHLFFYGPVS